MDTSRMQVQWLSPKKIRINKSLDRTSLPKLGFRRGKKPPSFPRSTLTNACRRTRRRSTVNWAIRTSNAHSRRWWRAAGRSASLVRRRTDWWRLSTRKRMSQSPVTSSNLRFKIRYNGLPAWFHRRGDTWPVKIPSWISSRVQIANSHRNTTRARWSQIQRIYTQSSTKTP